MNEWIKECSKEGTTFPVENKELVPASVHLTGPCWLSFRKYAIAKGVQIGRREATPAERAATGDKRKGKLYVIWAKLPVRPSEAVAHAEEKQKKSQEAAQKRKEQERKRQEEQKRKDRAKRRKVISAYETIVQEQTVPDVASSSVAKMPPKQEPEPAEDNDDISVPEATPQDLLNYAEEACKAKLMEIRRQMIEEKAQFEKEIKERQKKLEKEALEFSKKVKSSILATVDSNMECGMCKAKCKVLVAECSGCQQKICANCLVNVVDSQKKCYLCEKAWLGTKPKANGSSPVDESTIHQNPEQGLAKFSCRDPACRPITDFTYTYCCSNTVCDDHKVDYCCVCNGGRGTCVECGCGTCGSCGRSLCFTCKYKEGCMCADMRGSSMWDAF